MFMGLVLEYNQSLNDQEPLTVLASLERVLLDEARKRSETIFENFAMKLSDKLDPSLIPMDDSEFNQIIEQHRTEALSELIMKLRNLCSPTDMTDNFNNFDARLKAEIEKVTETNWGYSEENSKEMLQALTEKILLPKIKSTDDVKPTLSVEFSSEWARIIEEYLNHTKGPAKNTVLVNFIKIQFVNY